MVQSGRGRSRRRRRGGAARHRRSAPSLTAGGDAAARAAGRRRRAAAGHDRRALRALVALGAGGMGVVYAAYDPELDRKVAIKLLRAAEGVEHDVSHGRARLLREAQAMARLSHPNVVAGLRRRHARRGARRRVFVAMELVEGGTLRQWLKQSRARWREVLDVLLAGRARARRRARRRASCTATSSRTTCSSAPTGGVASPTSGWRARRRAEREDSRSTRRRASALTSAADRRRRDRSARPATWRPSSISGEPVDARTDQFSFCVALYEALYGERPFTGRDDGRARGATLARPRRASAERAAKLPGWLCARSCAGCASSRAARYAVDGRAARARSPPIRRGARVGSRSPPPRSPSSPAAPSSARRAVARGELCSGAERQLAGVWDAAARERVRAGVRRARTVAAALSTASPPRSTLRRASWVTRAPRRVRGDARARRAARERARRSA